MVVAPRFIVLLSILCGSIRIHVGFSVILAVWRIGRWPTNGGAQLAAHFGQQAAAKSVPKSVRVQSWRFCALVSVIWGMRAAICIHTHRVPSQAIHRASNSCAQSQISGTGSATQVQTDLVGMVGSRAGLSGQSQPNLRARGGPCCRAGPCDVLIGSTDYWTWVSALTYGYGLAWF